MLQEISQRHPRGCKVDIAANCCVLGLKAENIAFGEKLGMHCSWAPSTWTLQKVELSIRLEFVDSHKPEPSSFAVSAHQWPLACASDAILPTEYAKPPWI